MTNNFSNNSNKVIEMDRYDARARFHLDGNKTQPNAFGSKFIPTYLRSPYLFYEEKINELIKPNQKVLEIGSGMGLHTYSLIKTGAHVTATDISSTSLQVLKSKLQNVEGGVKIMVADMEKLPFEDQSFDVVVSAGSLSYGDAKKVDSEIHRIVKPRGYFICVDSLNNNPIYKLNRYIQYLRGSRTKLTIQNMPTFKRLEALKQNYSELDTFYFGSISYLMPILSRLIGEKNATEISDKIDNLFRIRKSAFKFVMIAKD